MRKHGCTDVDPPGVGTPLHPLHQNSPSVTNPLTPPNAPPYHRTYVL